MDHQIFGWFWFTWMSRLSFDLDFFWWPVWKPVKFKLNTYSSTVWSVNDKLSGSLRGGLAGFQGFPVVSGQFFIDGPHGRTDFLEKSLSSKFCHWGHVMLYSYFYFWLFGFTVGSIIACIWEIVGFLKGRKGQKQFFLKLHCPKSCRNFLKDFSPNV